MKFGFHKILFATIALLLCFACDSEMSRKLKSSYELDGQEIELEGYLIPGYYTEISDDGEINMDLLPDLYNIGEAIATVVVPFGNDPNSCNITKDRFSADDIEIVDDAFNKHDYKTKFKIKGTVKYTNREWASDTVLAASGSGAVNNSTSKIINAGRKDFIEKNKQAVLERKSKTGDPNDYSFVIVLKTINPL